MRIAQISLAEFGGGAERVAWTLHRGLALRGHETVLLTPHKQSHDPTVRRIDIDAGRPGWQRWLATQDRRWARFWASWRRRRGYDDWHHPWTHQLLSLLPWRPDVLLMHQLHGGWFDLHTLPALCAQVPTVVVLHDGWWLHNGPDHRCDLGTPPWPAHVIESNRPIRDAIYRRCRLHAVAPTQWMLSDMRNTGFEQAVISAGVIPHGIDTGQFNPHARQAARLSAKLTPSELGILAVDAAMGSGYRQPQVVIDAIHRLKQLGERSDAPPELRNKRVVLLTVGRGVLHRKAQRSLGDGAVRWLGVGGDPSAMSACYRAADVLAYATRADSFSLTLCEAMACGTPVVATGVGGIPEVVADGITGILVSQGDSIAMARSLSQLLGHPAKRTAMSNQAVRHVQERFNIDRMLSDYEAWLGSLLEG